MKYISILKIMSLIAYLLIFWNGAMISIPMFLYLPLSATDFDSPGQAVSSILAIIGLVIAVIISSTFNDKKNFFWYLLVFFLLLSPIIQRLSAVPINLFNYLLFIVPSLLFLISYILFLILIFKSTISKLIK